ncbi:MAG: helix-turn-helix domain-containing protein [Chitinophagales bacterium]|nr:helix-turn-helix domain-containing protein [Chitinophagales bacterium]MCZ2392696.1 helix-turn-helix domain-containing protein [Chitinophagales bacterium]
MSLLILLLIVVAFLLLTFSLHLFFTKQGSHTINYLLGFSFFARFFQVGVFLIIITSYTVLLPITHLFPIVQIIYTILYFGSLASSYLYIRCFINGEKYLKKSDLIHLVPIIFIIIHLFPYSLIGKINWEIIAKEIITGGQLSITEKLGVFPNILYNIVQLLFSVLYLLASWAVLFSSKFFSREWNINKKWMIFFISTSTFFKLLGFFAMVYGQGGRTYTNSLFFLSLCSIVLLYMLLFVIYQPQILYGYIVLSENYKVQETKVSVSTKNTSLKKIPNKEYVEWVNLLKNHVETKKLFLKKDLQMKDLSNEADLPAHNCSEVINAVLDKNFRDWINGYRIQYFIEQYPILKDNMTVEAVASQSGFKNMRTFYSAFKKETNQSPTEYFKNRMI